MSSPIDQLVTQIAELQTTLDRVEQAIANLVTRKMYNNWLAIKDKEIQALKARITSLETIINNS